jgi:hypothetical protein
MLPLPSPSGSKKPDKAAPADPASSTGRRPNRSAQMAEIGVASAMNKIAMHSRSKKESLGISSVETP